jgi:hypothetical protein
MSSLSSKASQPSFRKQRDSGIIRQASVSESTRQYSPTRSTAAESSHQIPISDEQEDDIWSARLGHANFHIVPAPYFPTTITRQSCQRLLDDWESARGKYMRLAADIARHYGPTSSVFALANEKWAGIDVQWREAHREAFQAVAILTLEEEAARCHQQQQDDNNNTLKSSSSPKQRPHRQNSTSTTTPPSPFVFQSLAETPSCSLPAPEDAYASFILPTTNFSSIADEHPALRAAPREGQVAKFPAVSPTEIIGPMVQYAAKVPMVTARGRKLPGGVVGGGGHLGGSFEEEFFSEKRKEKKRSRGCIPFPSSSSSSTTSSFGTPSFSGAREAFLGALRWRSSSSSTTTTTTGMAGMGMSEKRG